MACGHATQLPGYPCHATSYRGQRSMDTRSHGMSSRGRRSSMWSMGRERGDRRSPAVTGRADPLPAGPPTGRRGGGGGRRDPRGTRGGRRCALIGIRSPDDFEQPRWARIEPENTQPAVQFADGGFPPFKLHLFAALSKWPVHGPAPTASHRRAPDPGPVVRAPSPGPSRAPWMQALLDRGQGPSRPHPHGRRPASDPSRMHSGFSPPLSTSVLRNSCPRFLV